MTIGARQAALRILRKFTGRKIWVLADLHRKTGNNWFAPLILSNIIRTQFWPYGNR